MELTWHPVSGLPEGALPEGAIRDVQAGGRTVSLLRRDGRLFAFAPTCPHAGGRFCEGWVDARGLVVCPLHKYRFNPTNGRNTSGEGYKLKTYPVEERNGEIVVGIAG